MSKRNLILIIILIIIILAAVASAFLPSVKTKKSPNGNTPGTNFLSEFFPFGQNKTNPTIEGPQPTDISGYIPPSTPEIPKQKLTKVSSMPVAGYGVFMKERFKEEILTIPEPIVVPETGDETSPTPEAPEIPKPTPPIVEFAPSLRYVEKATGNIYQTFADKIDERKFTTTIIPQVYEAFIGNNGESVVMRYLKTDETTIETFAGTLPEEILSGDTGEVNEVKGSFLPEGITDISMSPNSSSIFYLFNTENSAIGVTALSSGDKKNQIFTSPFTEWLTLWPNSRMITLTTKPSFAVSGFAYSLDPNTKKMTKILSGINGLTTLTSPSGKLILYGNNNLSLRIYNIDTEDSVSFGVKTLPEKCVWNKESTFLYCAVPKNGSGARYPDTWYQGEISFSDDFWKINVENGATTNLLNTISLTGEEIDGIKLSLDENEGYLFFVNKKDSYLWELKLN